MRVGLVKENLFSVFGLVFDKFYSIAIKKTVWPRLFHLKFQGYRIFRNGVLDRGFTEMKGIQKLMAPNLQLLCIVLFLLPFSYWRDSKMISGVHSRPFIGRGVLLGMWWYGWGSEKKNCCYIDLLDEVWQPKEKAFSVGLWVDIWMLWSFWTAWGKSV